MDSELVSMRQGFHELRISTRGRGLYEFTEQVKKWISGEGFRDGLVTLHVRHTSASLLIQENADPDVQRDLEAFFERLVPDGDELFVLVLRLSVWVIFLRLTFNC